MSTTHRSDEPVDRPSQADPSAPAASTAGPDHAGAAPAHAAAVPVTAAEERDLVVARERDAYGGVKIGAAFFGWLVAVGIGVLLMALIAASGTAVGLVTDGEIDAADAETVGILGAILVLVVMFVAYFGGGYVAGRMARFDGARQGLAVFGWAIVIAVVVALLAWAAGTEYNLLLDVNLFPRLPIDEGAWTTAGIVAALLWLLASLGGAILGGLSGVRYHRKVDAAGFTPPAA